MVEAVAVAAGDAIGVSRWQESRRFHNNRSNNGTRFSRHWPATHQWRYGPTTWVPHACEAAATAAASAVSGALVFLNWATPWLTPAAELSE